MLSVSFYVHIYIQAFDLFAFVISGGGGVDPEPIRCRVDSPLPSSRESRHLLLPRFKQLRNPARGIPQVLMFSSCSLAECVPQSYKLVDRSNLLNSNFNRSG